MGALIEIFLINPPKPYGFVSVPLQSRLFPFFIKRGSLSVFFGNLAKNILKYILFTLPFILSFKALYFCWMYGVWTTPYFIQEFISNVPFFGLRLSEFFWGNDLILPVDKIQNHQNISQLIFVGGLGGCLGKSLFDSWFADYSILNSRR